LVGILGGAVSAAAAQDQLDAAKDLYASAAYEEALSALSRLNDNASGAPARTREVDEYRAFCLYALGRTAEAEAVAETLIRREPLAELTAADTSPRLEAMFAAVRKRMLPKLIRDQYRMVRTQLDDKQYAAAEPRLGDLQRLLTAAEGTGAWDEGLADLRVLVDGFLALARANVDKPASAVAPAPTAPAAAPTAAALPADAPASDAPPVARAGGASGPPLYSVEDTDVTPPVAIHQRAPGAPNQLRSILRTQRTPMILILTIDDTGIVQRAEVRGSLETSYDELLVREARNWTYTPAMRNGAPVWYVKPVVIEVK
jgi:hypothetical protein